jgi:hypothetical protein
MCRHMCPCAGAQWPLHLSAGEPAPGAEHICLHGAAGRVNVTRKQAFEALLTFEMDFDGPHFTGLSEGAQDLIRSLLQVRSRTMDLCKPAWPSYAPVPD